MVESKEISAHFTASFRLVAWLDDAVEDWLAVFHLADLEIDRIAHGFDEIAGVIDQEQPELPSLELAGKYEGGGEVDVVLLQIAAVDLVHFANGGANGAGRSEHGASRPQVPFRVAGIEPLAEQAHHPLGQRQVASGKQSKEALSPLLQHMHLAEGGDPVNAGIGAGIGSQH
jgi:hypothetical protein